MNTRTTFSIIISITIFLIFIIIIIIFNSNKENSNIEYFCDKEQGVQYIIYNGVREGGITIRRNNLGGVVTCKKEEKTE